MIEGRRRQTAWIDRRGGRAWEDADRHPAGPGRTFRDDVLRRGRPPRWLAEEGA